MTADDKVISLLRLLTKTNKDDHSAKKVRDISAGSTLHYNKWCSVHLYSLRTSGRAALVIDISFVVVPSAIGCATDVRR